MTLPTTISSDFFCFANALGTPSCGNGRAAYCRKITRARRTFSVIHIKKTQPRGFPDHKARGDNDEKQDKRGRT